MNVKNARARIAVASTAFVVAGSGGLLAFRSAETGADRAALERYDPAALEAVGQRIPDDNAEVVVVMEVRNVCQQVHAYATGTSSLAEITASIDGSTHEALAAGRRFDQSIDITEFSNYAKSRIEAAEKAGTHDPARQFLDEECGGTDFSSPVLAEG